MEQAYPWLGDLHALGFGREWTGLICIVASAACGALIGLERERRDKPAGLRTLTLIALGSTIFTLVSLLLGESKPTADPARLAAQILPGIGFLGAGAILRERGTVVGLTTGATIWAVAAVGVTIGAGYVAAGGVSTVIILIALTTLQRLEWIVTGRCRPARATVTFRPDSGKTLHRVREILDRHRVSERVVSLRERAPTEHVLEARICQRHPQHRVVLSELADLPAVVAIEIES